MKPGLQKLPKRKWYHKRFWIKPYLSHSKTFGAITEPLPKEYLLVSTILNQGSTYKCTAYSACAIQESQHAIQFDPDDFYYHEGITAGQQSDTGYDLKTVMKTGVNYGFKPLDPSKGRAKDFKEGGYFQVDGSGDNFDNVKSALWLAKDEKKTIESGTDWRDNWILAPQGIIPDEKGNIVGGHAVKICGWKEINGIDYIALQNSYGNRVGDSGLFYFDRTTFNSCFGEYGLFIWRTQFEQEQIKTVNVIVNKISALLSIISSQSQLYQLKIALLKTMAIVQKTTLLKKFCSAIKDYEGYFIGSRSYRNCNPGNIKCSQPFEKSLAHELGAIGQDADNFAKFKNFDAGFQALKDFVTLACMNKLKAYKNVSILEFFNIYAPSSDNNNPNSYASYVAKKVGLDIKDKMSVLL